MKINFNNFCSQLIFHPCKAETKRDRIIATIASVACALLFAGICHLVCAFRQFYIKRKNQNCPSDQKITEVAKPILLPKDEVKPSIPITNQNVVESPKEEVKSEHVAVKKADSEFVTLKSQSVTKKTAENVIHGQQVPLLQIEVCSQRQFPNGNSKCGYHALKNGLVGLGIAKGVFKSEDFDSAKAYQNFMEVFNTIFPERRDLTEPSVRKILKEILNAPQSSDLQPVHKAMKEYQNNISVITYSGSTPQEVELGHGACADNAQSIISFIELDKKLRLNQPFHHLFFIADYSSGHWITLILENDKKGNLCWYGMDSWDNQEYVLIDAVSMFSQLLEKMTISEERRPFIKKWYRMINSTCRMEPDVEILSKRWKDYMINYRKIILPEIKASINFMEYDHWFEDYNYYADEINEMKTILTFLNDNNYLDDPELQKMLKNVVEAA